MKTFSSLPLFTAEMLQEHISWASVKEFGDVWSLSRGSECARRRTECVRVSWPAFVISCCSWLSVSVTQFNAFFIDEYYNAVYYIESQPTFRKKISPPNTRPNNASKAPERQQVTRRNFSRLIRIWRKRQICSSETASFILFYTFFKTRMNVVNTGENDCI
jgi:hypothetical protein